MIIILLFIYSVTCMDSVTKDLVTPLRYTGEACGYESCPRIKQDMLNVHIVPHTHGELGYTRTFYQHYSGNDDFYDKSQINMKRILDYTITELWANERRKFTLSDTSYFFQWWSNRDDTVRRMVYQLLRQGRLHFVGGGWSMSDESTTSYHAIIDHFTYNLKKLNATFLTCGRPLVTWQAEVLGHSREFASLMGLMGFDGHFVSPISFEDELARMRRKALEFIWRGSDDLGAESDIYTHKLFDGYWSPPGFCFGGLCNDPLLVTSDSVFRNLDDRLDEFFKSVLYRQAPYYSTNNIMIIMGQRLGYYDAGIWFANIDKLIDHANNKSMNGTRINVFYSSPACYLKAIHDDNPKLPTKQDDFLPLGYDVDSYATGLYTSRPTIKFMAKEGHLYLQITKQLHVIARLGNNDKFFEEYNWINGVFQDHTIITGGMRAHVTNYYTEKMYRGTQSAVNVIRQALKSSPLLWIEEILPISRHAGQAGWRLFGRTSFVTRQDVPLVDELTSAHNKLRRSPMSTLFYRCSFNVSSCTNTHGGEYFVVIYNPLAWPVTIPVRLPVYRRNYVVYGPDGTKKRSALIPIPEPVQKIPYRTSKSRDELVFLAEELPPMGYRSYFIRDHQLGWIRPKRSVVKKNNRNNDKKYLPRQTDSGNANDNRENNEINVPSNVNNDGYEYFDDTTYKSEYITSTDNITERHDDFIMAPPKNAKVEINGTKAEKEYDETDKAVKKFHIDFKGDDVNGKLHVTTDWTLTPNVRVLNTQTNINDFNKYKSINGTEPFVTIDESTNNKETMKNVIINFNKSELSENKNENRVLNDNIEDKFWKGSNYINVVDRFIKNRYVKINVDKHGKINLVQLVNGLNMSLNIEFYFYASDDPVKLDAIRKKPGAYIFRPMDLKPEVILNNFKMKAYKNGLLQEIHYEFSDYASLAVTLYRRTPYIALKWVVGPIPVQDEIGKEIFIRYSTDLDNNGVFYTDSNGRQTIKRIRNNRASFELANQDPVAGNYYPVTSKIYIEDVKRNIRFSVLNDRAQGGSSLNDGQIDLMLHRRILTDDNGIQAILNETEHGDGVIVSGNHYLYITKADYKPNMIFEKKLAKEIELKPQIFVSKKSPYGRNSKYVWQKHNNEFSAVRTKLPLGIHILTLEKWNINTILLRLENYLEGSDTVESGVKKVLLNKIFKDLKLLNAKEATLGANMLLKDWTPLKWDRYEGFLKNFNDAYGTGDVNFNNDEELMPITDFHIDEAIQLAPQQIRTFFVTFEYVNNLI